MDVSTPLDGVLAGSESRRTQSHAQGGVGYRRNKEGGNGG